MMNDFVRDLRYVFRVLWKNPAFTAVAVLTLALGIGATASIFTVVNAVILQPMPFEDSEELVVLWETHKARQWPVSPGNFADWRDDSESFQQMVLADLKPFSVTGEGPPLRVQGARVTVDFFDMLRRRAAAGRLFQPSDDTPGQDKVVVLSHGLWQRRFGGKEDLVGQTLRLDDVPYEVIGITPRDFEFPYLGEAQELWVPLVIGERERREGREVRSMGAIGRIKPGLSVEQAEQELESVARRLEEEHPVSNEGWGVDLVSLYKQAVRDSGKALMLLLGAVAFLLFIALVNVANLMMARNTVRQRETSLRVALGAGRGTIARQLMTESTVMGLIAGLLGLGIAFVTTRLLLIFNPGDIPRLAEAQVNGPVILFALGVSLAVGLVLGLVPVLGLARLDHYACLKEGGGKATGSRRSNWVRNSLLTLETALVLVLLMAGGLMIQGFQRLLQEDPGFDPEDRFAVEVPLLPAKYPDIPQKRQFFEQLEERLEGLPGVRKVGLVSTLPLSPTSALSLGFVEEGKPVDLANVPQVGYDVATPGFFEAAGIPLVSGRLFDERDREASTDVLLVNETMAKRFWPGESPLGKRIQIRDPQGPWVEIVGVVGDVKHQGLGSDPRPAMYQPLGQMAVNRRTMQAVVWSAPGQEASLANAVRQAGWQIDPTQTMEVRLLEDLTRDSLKKQRFNMLLLVFFSVIALILGAVGIYGVVSYTVSQLRRQIGIRTALGAQKQDVFQWIGVRGMKPVLAGIAAGAVAALLLGNVIARILYEVSPTDPTTLAAVSLILLFVAAIAIYFPARRATRVDPLVVLKAE